MPGRFPDRNAARSGLRVVIVVQFEIVFDSLVFILTGPHSGRRPGSCARGYESTFPSTGDPSAG